MPTTCCNANVTKRLPPSDKQFFLHFDESVRHVRNHERFGRQRPEGVRAYEFGAGWDLVGPLGLWALGVSQQVLVDIDAHLRVGLVNHSIGQLVRHHATLMERAGRPIRMVDPAPVRSIGDLQERFRHRLPGTVRRSRHRFRREVV